jgi:hypothetical protein
MPHGVTLRSQDHMVFKKKGHKHGCHQWSDTVQSHLLTLCDSFDEPLWLLRLQDHMVFKKKGHKHCPKIGKCMNCMPTGDNVDDFKCWAVKQPVTYKVRGRFQ